MSIPSFSEYDYQEKIESIYIMHMSGLFLYKKTFREKVDDFDETVVSGTIASIKMMLESVSDKKGGILTIEKRGKIIIIQPGKYVIGVLICDEKLNSLQILLNKFIEKISDAFQITDIVRAKVIRQEQNEYSLSTVGKNLGVIHADCSICGTTLEKIGVDRLRCPRCGNIENRKLASDYGNVTENLRY